MVKEDAVQTFLKIEKPKKSFAEDAALYNGIVACKSTFRFIRMGIQQRDGKKIWLCREEIEYSTPDDALKSGISIIEGAHSYRTLRVLGRNRSHRSLYGIKRREHDKWFRPSD